MNVKETLISFFFNMIFFGCYNLLITYFEIRVLRDMHFQYDENLLICHHIGMLPSFFLVKCCINFIFFVMFIFHSMLYLFRINSSLPLYIFILFFCNLKKKLYKKEIKENIQESRL
jgi:hypothetical protein